MSNARNHAPPLRIGILGCANISRQFVRDVAPSPAVEVVAVASRQMETASAFAKAHDIGRHYASYETLLADADLDAIYLPLPNSMHADWAIRAAQAGKHVLCEKPLCLGLAQAQRMFDAARKNNVILLESFPYYFQPQTGAMLKVLHGGEIGDVRSVQTCFGFTLANPTGNIRMNPELGGGALLDAGSYALSLIRLVMGCAPSAVMTAATWSESGVDISATATLYYADGRRTQLSCGMDTAYHRHATIVGSAGVIETEYLNHTSAQVGSSPYGYLPGQLRVRRGTATTVPYEDIVCGTGSGFRFAAEAFADVVRAKAYEAVGSAERASLDNAATLEAMARSAKLGERVSVEM
jgi:predicted dehydrogenase